MLVHDIHIFHPIFCDCVVLYLIHLHTLSLIGRCHNRKYVFFLWYRRFYSMHTHYHNLCPYVVLYMIELYIHFDLGFTQYSIQGSNI